VYVRSAIEHDVVFFFFQAEDGIRDWSVTGVQTCALPISKPAAWKLRDCAWSWAPTSTCRTAPATPHYMRRASLTRVSCSTVARQIGRASCRERGWISVGGG